MRTSKRLVLVAALVLPVQAVSAASVEVTYSLFGSSPLFFDVEGSGSNPDDLNGTVTLRYPAGLLVPGGPLIGPVTALVTLDIREDGGGELGSFTPGKRVVSFEVPTGPPVLLTATNGAVVFDGLSIPISAVVATPSGSYLSAGTGFVGATVFPPAIYNGLAYLSFVGGCAFINFPGTLDNRTCDFASGGAFEISRTVVPEPRRAPGLLAGGAALLGLLTIARRRARRIARARS